MDTITKKEDKYIKIIETICEIKGISKNDIPKILKDRECKYLLFLLLKKYKCADIEMLNKDFLIESQKSINYNYKKAEEKFFINKEFRDMYFEIDNIINKSIL
ncbi:hypothetical protein SAMN05428976_104184 [Clostridium sp. USBA 49]|uniref:ribose-5-phosphate isomerase n=1 Tax=Clostridium TaxID=1485 RepID=UPI0009C4E1C4|nr:MULTISPECIES: ribose-5-phosphate isomerase [Clostridium]SKA81380.1 hypothetical protein SAMN05428976_104184 [Clostridium sp. USBA 49]